MHSLVSFHGTHSDVFIAGSALFSLNLCSVLLVEADGMLAAMFTLGKSFVLANFPPHPTIN